MARSVANGTFSPPPLSSTTSTNGTATKPNVVSRLAIEGKAKQNLEGANVKLYIKLNIPHDSASPSQVIPLFAEEDVKLKNYQVHPIDSDSAPYDFDLKDNPLLQSAARALNLPARISQSYLSLFHGSSHSSSSRSTSMNGSVVPELEERYSGYFIVSGYNICFVLPKDFPPMFKSRSSSTDSDDASSSRFSRSSMHGRRSSILGRPSLQFMAALELWVPFASKPSRAPYLVSIPLPRCLSNTIRFRLFSPSSISNSFASLSSDEDAGGWDVATVPHVNRTSLKHSTRTNSYSTLADDESSESSLQGVFENCLVQGTFTSTERISIRWASPLRTQLFLEGRDGRRRVRVGDVKGNMTCTILDQSVDGVKMRLDYQGTCTNVWFPGVATMLGLDVALESNQCDVSWPAGMDGGWSIDSDSAMTGYNIGAEHRPISHQTSLELPTMAIPGASHSRHSTIDDAPLGPTRTTSSASLLRIPIPSEATREYSFEDSPLTTPATSNLPSSIASLTPSVSQSSLVLAMTSQEVDERKQPAVPITLHINMNDLHPSEKNKFVFNISGTVVVSRSGGTSTSSVLGSVDLPTFHVLSNDNEHVTAVVRNQTEDANIEIHSSYSGGSTISQDKMDYRSRDRKVLLPVGTQVQCGLQGTEILVKPIQSTTSVKSEEHIPSLTQSRHPSPVPGNSLQTPRALGSPSKALPRRDGPLVLPWLNVIINPLSRITEDKWSYAVTFTMPSPMDISSSDWFDFGLAMPPRGSQAWQTLTSAGIPTVDIACASIDGVPVRFEMYGQLKRDAGEETDYFSLLDTSSPEKSDWLTWVRVHITVRGTLEVVYIVRGDAPNGKGKRKTQDLLDAQLFIPQVPLPIARLFVDLASPGGLEALRLPPGIGSSASMLHFRDFAVEPLASYDMGLRFDRTNGRPRGLLSAWTRFSATSGVLILLTLLMTSSILQTINMRKEMRQMSEILNTLSSGDLHIPMIDPASQLSSSILSLSSSSSLATSTDYWWTGKKSAEPTLSPSQPAATETELAHTQSPLASDMSSYWDSGSLPPMVYIPFTWPFQIEYEEMKRHAVASWDKVWRVLEIVLHWPLPVPRNDL